MFYRFTRTKSDRPLGIGTEGLALEQPTTLPAYNPYSRKYTVQSQLDPQAPGYVKMGQQFVPVSLVGNGSMLQGQLALQALAELTKG